ncbi:hypothetical protein KIPB_015885, partial [Kipferlia bialata]|eukprot:g15885.t1
MVAEDSVDAERMLHQHPRMAVALGELLAMNGIDIPPAKYPVSGGKRDD